jgi:hypothetical protein
MAQDTQNRPQEPLDGPVGASLPSQTRLWLLWCLERAEADLLDLERRQREQEPMAGQLAAPNPAEDSNRAANRKRLEIKQLRYQLGLDV